MRLQLWLFSSEGSPGDCRMTGAYLLDRDMKGVEEGLHHHCEVFFCIVAARHHQITQVVLEHKHGHLWDRPWMTSVPNEASFSLMMGWTHPFPENELPVPRAQAGSHCSLVKFSKTQILNILSRGPRPGNCNLLVHEVMYEDFWILRVQVRKGVI